MRASFFLTSTEAKAEVEKLRAVNHALAMKHITPVRSKPKSAPKPKKPNNPKIDKAAVLTRRYGSKAFTCLPCECGCGAIGHELHHIIGRMKGYPILDDDRNLILVNSAEHSVRKFDNQKWKANLWMRQISHYGIKKMGEYTQALIDAGLEHRLDFLP